MGPLWENGRVASAGTGSSLTFSLTAPRLERERGKFCQAGEYRVIGAERMGCAVTSCLVFASPGRNR